METVKVTLLVRHPDNKEKLLVNFDPAILEVFREIQYLSSIGLEVPPSAQNFYFKKNMLKETYQAVEVGLVIMLYDLYNFINFSVYSIWCMKMKEYVKRYQSYYNNYWSLIVNVLMMQYLRDSPWSLGCQ